MDTKVQEAWTAVQYDRLEVLKSLITSSIVSPNASTYSSTNHIQTLLMCAAAHGSIECAQFLLDKGAKVDNKNFAGYTALHWAAYTGRTETIDLLANKGANLEARTEDGKTPLHIAAQRGHLEFIKAFLKLSTDDRPIDINSVASNGWNALFFAVMANQQDVAEYLVKQGIDKDSPDAENKTVDAVAEKYHRFWLKSLLHHEDSSQQ